jgi:prepilin-type N-terminal cleavage/methylation domain-containing protein
MMKGDSMIKTHHYHDRQGFTLVELIVVIAIIAILASVSVVGFTRFIDNARWSNDVQVASGMTNVLEAHFAGDPLNEELNVADVIRTIINDNNGAPFDFTPSSRDAGFFFIESTSSIEVYKYEDIVNGSVVLDSTDNTVLLSDAHPIDFQSGKTPEELFGSGSHLLTTRGSIVAEVVHGLRQIANSADFSEAYNEIEEKINGLESTLFFDVTALKSALQSFIVTYDVTQTLFISHSEWRSGFPENPGLEDRITRIVFAPDMVHLPAYNGPDHLEYEDLADELKPIVLPGTIKTAIVRYGAYSYSVVGGVPVHTPLTPFIDPDNYPDIRFMTSIPLLPDDYIRMDSNTKLTLTMPSSVKTTVVGYDIRLFDTSSEHSVIIYTVNGILGEVRVDVS